MAVDAPDWERVVALISGGAVSDAPDWQRTVTGPGAAPVGGGPGVATGVVPPGMSATTYDMALLWTGATANLNAGQIYASCLTAPADLATVTAGMLVIPGTWTTTPATSGLAVYGWDIALSQWSLVASGLGLNWVSPAGSPYAWQTLALGVSTPLVAGDPYWVAALWNGTSGPTGVGYTATQRWASPFGQYVPVSGSPFGSWLSNIGALTGFPTTITPAHVQDYNNSVALGIGP